MNSSDFEIFYNWNNNNRTNDQLQLRTIQSRMRPLLEKKAYSLNEIEEILVAEGYKETLVKEALKIKDNSSTKPNIAAESKGVPTKYSDIAPKFEKVLQASGPSGLVKLLTEGKSPLIKISKKETLTFRKIAELAYDDPAHLATLHAYLRPSVVSELSENICRARKMKEKCVVAKVNDDTYEINYNGKKVQASIKPVKSSSEKFAQSNYGYFDFPDEYVILAYEESSPYSQIIKDL